MSIKNTDLQQQLHAIFSQLVPFSESAWEKFLPVVSFNTYQPKEIIFSSGDMATKVHFVTSGIGRYFYIDKEGKETNKSLVRTGGAFASVSTLVQGLSQSFLCTGNN